MIPEDPFRQTENANSQNKTAFNSKTTDLKSMIQKIVKANQVFMKENQAVKDGGKTTSEDLAPPIEVNPKEIVFENISPNSEYVLNFVVTNQTNRQRKIKFILPKSSSFTFENSSNTILAPGLSLRCKVFCHVKSTSELRETFYVVSDEAKIAVPISAFGQKGKLVVDSYVDLGIVQKDVPVSFTSTLTNLGKKEIYVEMIAPDDFSLTAEALPMLIHPNQTVEVKFEAVFSKIETFESSVQFACQGMEEKQYMHVKAHVVDPLFLIVDKNAKQIKEMNFGELLTGSEKRKRVTLINNSSNPLRYRATVFKGTHIDNEHSEVPLQTPYDVGRELLEQVLFVEPAVGEIPSYGFLDVDFKLKLAPTREEKYLVSKFAIYDKITDQEVEYMLTNTRKSYEYTAIFQLEDQSGQESLAISALAYCPLVNFSQQEYNLGEVEKGQSNKCKMTITNHSSSHSVEVTMPVESFLHFNVKKVNLKPKQQADVEAIFCPKNLGVFDRKLAFKVNHGFPVNIGFFGQCKMNVKAPIDTNPQYRKTLPMIHRPSKMDNNMRLSNMQNNELTLSQSQFRTDQESLINSNDRANSISKMNIKQMRMGYSLPKMPAKGKAYKNKYTDNYNFLSEEFAPMPIVPKSNPALFVLKPIKNNEPSNLRNLNYRFQPDPRQQFKEFSSIVKDHEEAKQITERLSGEKLMRILVGPNELDFGNVFVNSTACLFFQIKNDLWSSISAALFCENTQELRETSFKTQIIPSGKIAGFKVSVSSSSPAPFHETVGYVINGHHLFRFLVKANFVRVDLELSRSSIAFKFKDESTDMSTSESIILKNNGNCSASYKFIVNSPSAFRVVNSEGIIPANSSKEVEIVYTPYFVRDDENIILEIDDGTPRTIKCTGSVNEITSEIIGATINLGVIAVGQSKPGSFSIKNTHNKYYAIFKILENTIPEGMVIHQKSGKICPDDVHKIDFEFCINKKIDYRSHEIQILVRGLGTLKVFLTVNTIVPKIEIEQPNFNFEKVTFGNKSSLPLTLTNKSSIPAELLLDLCSPIVSLQEKLNCIDIEYLQKPSSESIVFEKREGPADSHRNKIKNTDKRVSMALNPHEFKPPKDLDHRQDSIEYMPKKSLKVNRLEAARDSEEEPKNYIFYLKPNRTYNFAMIFSPSKPIIYDFDLNFYLPGQEADGSLIRKVKCTGTNPRFVMQPLNGVIEFPKKIILNAEAVSQDMKTLTITNPSPNEPLNWALDLTSLEEHKVFTIAPTSGRIEPKATLSLKIGFKPMKPQVYECIVPLKIDNESASHAEIKIRGEGSYPKILFSKEELILSPIPLGCTSVGFINFINDGYQNSTLIATIPPEYSKIGLAIEFVDGNLIGITHPDIRLKVTFTSLVPISFTAKILVEDDLKRCFSFFVSGIADNSILTHGPFLELGFFMQGVFAKSDELDDSLLSTENDTPAKFAIKIDNSTKAPKLVNLLDKKSNDYDGKHNSYPEVSARSHDSDGDRINVATYYDQIANSICIWLAEYGISNVSKFPDDLITTNGQHLYDLLEFLLKNPPPRTPIEPNAKHIDRIKVIIQNYNGLINILKENNAMINCVRPYFLLSYKDLGIYFKHNINPHVLPEYYKFSESQHRTISLINWVTLFLQVIKVFFVSRITLKEYKSAISPLVDKKKNLGERSAVKFNEKPKGGKDDNQLAKGKSFSGKPDAKGKELNVDNKTESISPIDTQFDNKEGKNQVSSILPDYPYDRNKVYSNSEALILKWLEIAFYLKTKETTRIADYGKELRGMQYFAAAIDTYLGSESNLMSKIKTNPTSQHDYFYNFELMKTVLLEFGIKEELDEKEFITTNSISMLLFGLHLFKTLPYYLPRATIEFECSLHEKLQKEIILNNPTNKTIIYSVKIFGHKNFSIENDLVKLEGKMPVPFPVTYYANTSLPVDGKIFFQNRRNGKSVAGAVVFNLRAKVNNRFSMKTFTISNVNLYEMSSSDITVVNPFDKDVTFKVVIENLESVKEVKNKSKNKQNQAEESIINGEKKRSSPPMFFIKTDKLSIRKNHPGTKITIHYFPVTFETHRCYLVFLDPRVGEMQYEIIGTPNPPLPLDTFRVSYNIENYNNIEVNIPYKNSSMQGALLKMMDRLKEFKEYSALPFIEKMQQSQETQFEIEISSNDFVSSSSQIINFGAKNGGALKNSPNSDSNGLAKNQQGGNNQLSQKLSPKQPITANQNGQYKLTLMPVKKVPVKDLHVRLHLKGLQKFDQRVYDLYLTIIPKTVKAVIEMKSTARMPIIQNIPIANNVDIECSIKPVFTPILNGHLFEVPQGMLTLKKKTVYNLPLKFNCQWIDKAEAKLMIMNTTTNDNFEYHIKAECEEPLSEDHLDIYTKAKKMTEFVIKVKNPIVDSRTFKVETDIPDATYQRNVMLDDKLTEFKINFLPIIGGNFMYSVTFTDEIGRYFWYLITLHVDSPEPSRLLSINSEIRKPTILKIELDNQKNKAVTYKVMIIGDYLSGDKTFELESYSKDCYQLFYFPLKIESTKKKIGFLSEEEGEHWFDIDCRSEESKPVKLPTFKAELGKWITQQVVLKNPLKKKTTVVTVEHDENSNFKIASKRFEIPPNESLAIDVTYLPKELSKNENEIINFRSNEIGDWKYHVFGIGILPTDYEPTTISTALGTSATKTLTFKNPFDHECYFHIYCEATDKSKDVFDIIVPKQKNNLIAAFSTFQIIVKFSPSEIFTYQAKIIVKLSETLFWCYPILGVTEAIQGYSEFMIKTKCGSEVEVPNNYKLIGITNFNPEETFDYSIKVNHKEAANIEKWLKIVPVKNRITSINEELRYNFVFLPLKPLKTMVEFIISRSSGGRWKFKMQLEATEPDFFETLTIVSQLNIKKTIHFRLFNSDKKNSNAFIAYFTQDSDSEFVVNPTKGILEPAINDGTVLEVSYLPTQYGKAKTGTLIVETDQFYWRFLVKGMFEKYVPPSFKKTTKLN